MQKLFLYFLIVFMSESCKNSSSLIINIDSNYHGWIYLIPAKVRIQERYEIKPNSLGIIYLSDSLYDQSNTINLIVKINDILDAPRPVMIYDVSFYPENRTYKIMYKKFYFPLTSTNTMAKEDSLYLFKENKYNSYYLNQFEYYYVTGIIDSNIVKKW